MTVIIEKPETLWFQAFLLFYHRIEPKECDDHSYLCFPRDSREKILQPFLVACYMLVFLRAAMKGKNIMTDAVRLRDAFVLRDRAIKNRLLDKLSSFLGDIDPDVLRRAIDGGFEEGDAIWKNNHMPNLLGQNGVEVLDRAENLLVPRAP